MSQSFDWGEQVFPVPAAVLWHATKLAIENSGQQIEGVDDFTMAATIKSKVSWTSWGEVTNMQVTTRGNNESILRVESSSGSVTSKTENHVIYILSKVRDLLVANAEAWKQELGAHHQNSDSGSDSLEARLQKLKSLLDKGLIDSNEYESKKRAILDEL
jgi:hypothetical protein